MDGIQTFAFVLIQSKLELEHLVEYNPAYWGELNMLKILYLLIIERPIRCLMPNVLKAKNLSDLCSRTHDSGLQPDQ